MTPKSHGLHMPVKMPTLSLSWAVPMLWNMQDAVYSHNPGAHLPISSWVGRRDQCPYRDWFSRGAQVLGVKLQRKSLEKQNMNLSVLDSRVDSSPLGCPTLGAPPMSTLNRASESREKPYTERTVPLDHFLTGSKSSEGLVGVVLLFFNFVEK